jgi:hypothetical protein
MRMAVEGQSRVDVVLALTARGEVAGIVNQVCDAVERRMGPSIARPARAAAAPACEVRSAWDRVREMEVAL